MNLKKLEKQIVNNILLAIIFKKSSTIKKIVITLRFNQNYYNMKIKFFKFQKSLRK